jgi:hypothetical protein
MRKARQTKVCRTSFIATRKRQPRRAEQSRIVSAFSAHDLTTRSGNGKGAPHNFFMRMLRRQFPRG